MSNIITIGYVTEGTTDKRFLEAIIRKTFEEIAFGCPSLIEVYDPIHIDMCLGDTYVAQVEATASEAYSKGISVLCIHVDSDSAKDINVMKNKILPAFNNVENIQDQRLCKNLVALIPMQMSEAWMLADKNLFKEEVGTNLSDEDLGINKKPELFADPKGVIEEALRRAQIQLPRRRNKILISDIYQPIGQKLSLQSLRGLSQ